jgi:hypothetical protein
MRYLIKPYEVKNTNSLGFAKTSSYIAEAVEGEIVIAPKTVGTLGVKAYINVGIYSLEKDKDGGYDINQAKLEEVRNIREADLTQAGISLADQQKLFAGIAFGDTATQNAIVTQLISAFGLELA